MFAVAVKNNIYWLLTSLFPVFLLLSISNFSLAATYTASPPSTSEGNSKNWGAQFIMSASISGSTATYQISKKVGAAFTSSGTMHLKEGTYEHSGTDHAAKPVTANVTETVTFTENLDSYSAASYPQTIYARYETADGLDWSWVGPITITRTETATPTGAITAPGSTAQGNFTVSCNAEAPAGLKEVSVYFGNNTSPLIMCKDGTDTPCPTSIGSWSKNSINPLDYGVSGPGSFTIGLLVTDDADSKKLVDTQSVTWSQEPPPSGATGSITAPGSTAQGKFTLSCNASASAGLKEVSVYFGNNDLPVTLCKDGGSDPCPATSGSWSKENINPLEHGISGPGSFNIGLIVIDDTGHQEMVDTQTVNWSEEPPPANTPPSGSLNTPGSLVVGPLTLQATAADADGLKKVSVVFAPDSTLLVLCDDASSHPCTGGSGSWELAGIDPAQYGAAAGSITLALHVQDDASGNTETLAASTAFSWIPPDNQFPAASTYFNVCVGHNYEQQMPLPDTVMPEVSLIDAPASVKSGQRVLLHAKGAVDTAKGGSAFYYYCTRQGSLLYDDAKPDQVTWIAPLLPGFSQPVKLYTQIGDGLGYIDSEVKTVNVSGSLTQKVSYENALIHSDEILRKSISLDKYINKLVAFVVKWPGSDIDLLLTKPDGTTLDYTGKTVFGYYEGKTQEYYVVYNDQPGTWQIDLKAVDVAEEGEPYEFIVYADSGSQNSGEADSDNDGIPDAWEQEHFGDLSHNAATDADNDGLNDLVEFQHGTDPNKADSDNDGMPDGWEVAHGLDPLTNDSGSDADHDGFSNLDEYLAGTNPQDASSTPLNCAATVPDDFSLIQDAINHVAANAFGGTVCVRPGTYVEPKLKLTDGVYLAAMSSDPAATIIDGNGKDDVITCQGVRVGGVIGFTLRNSKKNGNAAAVNITGAKQMPLIAKNIISGNRHGIRLQGNVMPVVINNTIADNSGDGITAGGSSRAKVLNNIVVRSKGRGIVRKGKAIDKLARNDVYDNKHGNYVGIAAGEGGISLDPRFSDGYRLVSDSPCIGTGQSLDGKPVDMGAYGSSTAALINNTSGTTMFADSDRDGIDDNWEQLFFGNLTTADSSSDYDRDGYSDLQEYLNNRSRHLDPKGVSFDLTAANAPGGDGYTQDGGSTISSSRIEAVLRLLLKRKVPKKIPPYDDEKEKECPESVRCP